MNIQELLTFSVKQKASDLHISAGLPPLIRVDGDIRRINVEDMDHKFVHGLIYDVMTDKQRKEYEEHMECDFSFEIPGLARFRVNAFVQNRGAGAVFRTIPAKIQPMDQLGMGDVFRRICDNPRGLVCVTGPTGSGKSTTLAAMVDHINHNRYEHILTIEDPIEFVHQSMKSLINQREVHRDTHSFAAALRSALREDPDIILVGELRDLETIRLALTAAGRPKAACNRSHPAQRTCRHQGQERARETVARSPLRAVLLRDRRPARHRRPVRLREHVGLQRGCGRAPNLIADSAPLRDPLRETRSEVRALRRA